MGSVHGKTVSGFKSELLLGSVLLLISGVLHFSSIFPGHNWGGDFAAYIHQGKSLANGSIEQLNALVQFRMEYSTPDWTIGPDYYPWGYPVALAGVIFVFGESIFAIKAMGVIFVLATQVALYFLFRGRTSMTVSFAIAFVYGINVFVFQFKNLILSDIPFTFFVVLTLLCCRKYLLPNKSPSIAELACIGLSMLAAFSIRTHAVALLPTVAFLQLWGRANLEKGFSVSAIFGGLKRIRLPDFIPCLIFVLGVAAIISISSDPVDSYVKSGDVDFERVSGQLLGTIKTGVTYYGELPNHLFRAPVLIYSLVIVPLLLIGVFRTGVSNIDLAMYTLVHMAILLVFPGRQGLRFILPILPVLFFFLIVGGREVANWISKNRADAKSNKLIDRALAAMLIVGLSGPVLLQAYQTDIEDKLHALNTGPYSESSVEAFDYIRANVDDEQNVVFWKPRVLSYLTNKKSAFAYSLEDLTSGRYDYVLVYLTEYRDDERGKELVTVTSTNPEYFRSVFENRKFILFEVISET